MIKLVKVFFLWPLHIVTMTTELKGMCVCVCVELTGGVAAHIAGLQDRRWWRWEWWWALEWSQVHMVCPSVQKHKLASVDHRTSSHRPSYHSSCHPPSALLCGHMTLHHKHLDRRWRGEVQLRRCVIWFISYAHTESIFSIESIENPLLTDT